MIKLFSILVFALVPQFAFASSVECHLMGVNSAQKRLESDPKNKGQLSGKVGVYEATVVFAERKDVKLIEMQIVDSVSGKLATSRSSHKGQNAFVSVATSLEDFSGTTYAELVCIIQ